MTKVLSQPFFPNKWFFRSSFFGNKPKFLEADHFCHNLFLYRNKRTLAIHENDC
ncbi:hypothetical protein HMPREF1366_02907 [Enterococcus faecium ERV26]|nr:hypothetical protein HMPREF1381_01493 [Enterococcus faecium R501]EJX65060.1 hypothetical protein HMPREF1376_00472 [Enterococcus faecium R446]EJX73364.1 hypothetical protein HMPREF1373_00533 [Enterococcus faecium P1140]EJX87875.1 hypothetical protein HMPREF1367_02328 [Enterococcus faecium ERV38]EJX88594.1 hypothetical protein HMPREF1366_02907 [Enterococcus faecium ERV26]EJX97980.1 hypothetical protein HMPREF1365_00283 [Enterococcus faecium ERV168]EJY04010.1 hypothetical protein HMPREF1362_0